MHSQLQIVSTLLSNITVHLNNALTLMYTKDLFLTVSVYDLQPTVIFVSLSC